MTSHKSKKSKQINICDNSSANGLLLQQKYIPEEILIKILCDVDYKTLLSCQLVCKQWKNLIQRFVWLKKAEEAMKRKLLYIDRGISWMAYYFISAQLPFNKNLIKNPSAEEPPFKHWEIPKLKNIVWTRVGIRLPEDSLFDPTKNFSFLTSHEISWKYQIVDLISKGFSPFLLDEFQPSITVSEWYCCKETPALYLCDIEFLKDNDEKMVVSNGECECHFQDHYTFTDVVKNTKRDKWLKFEHTFKNYGRGLRKIKFIHGGRSQVNPAHRVRDISYGVKITRACIKIDLPLNSCKNKVA